MKASVWSARRPTVLALLRKPTVLPLVLIGLGFALRLYRLDSQSLWFDEAWTAGVVTQGATAILQATAKDVHPPLYFLLLHAWTGLAGTSEWALRFVSVVAGVILLPLSYLLGVRLQSRRAGLLAAAITAVAPLHVYYAQEARDYSLLTALTLASTYLLVKMCTHLESASRGEVVNRWLLGYVGITVLSLYAHYTAFYVLVAQVFFLAHWWWRRRHGHWALLSSQLLILSACLPWLLYLWVQRAWPGAPLGLPQDPLAFRAMWLWQNLVAVTFGLTAVPPLAPAIPRIAHVIQMLLLGIVVVGAIEAWNSRPNTKSHESQLLVWIFAIALVLAIFLGVPGHPRHVIVSTPSYYLLLGFGLDRIARGVLSQKWRLRQGSTMGAALLALVIVASARFLDNQYHNLLYAKSDDYEGVFSHIQWSARPNDALILTYDPFQLVLAYYWRGQVPDTYCVPSKDEWADGQLWSAHTEARLRKALDSHSRLWLVEDLSLSLDRGMVERWLRDNTHKAYQQTFGRTRVSLFSRPEARLEVPGLQVNFDNTLLFHDAEVDSAALESGAVLHYVLRWKFLRATPADYSISVSLSDDSNSIYATNDNPLMEESYPAAEWTAGDEVEQRLGLLIPPGSPPGWYQLKLTLHDVSAGLTLSVLDHNSRPVGPELSLGQVEILPSSHYPRSDVAPIDQVLHQRLTDELQLIGYNILSQGILLGDIVPLDLYWQANERPTQDFLVSVRVKDLRGQLVYERAQQPADGHHPFSRWSRGEVVIDRHLILVPAERPPGWYQVTVALLDPNTQDRVVERVLGHISLGDRPRQFTVPPIPNQLAATLGGKVQLLGYQLTPLVAVPGDSLQLSLYWRCLSPLDTSYTVFAHLIDDSETIWGQMDSIPGRGTVPTSGWVAGEVIVDPYEIPVAVEVPAGCYRIEVGMYNAATWERLVVVEDEAEIPGARLLLPPTIQIVRP